MDDNKNDPELYQLNKTKLKPDLYTTLIHIHTSLFCLKCGAIISVRGQLHLPHKHIVVPHVAGCSTLPPPCGPVGQRHLH